MTKRVAVTALALTVAWVSWGCSSTKPPLLTGKALPAVSQPPDPCKLLTTAEIATVLHRPVQALQSTARPAVPAARPGRDCEWVAGRFISMDMDISTQAALDASCLCSGVTDPERRLRLADLFGPGTVPPPGSGLGDLYTLNVSNSGGRISLLTGSSWIIMNLQNSGDPPIADLSTVLSDLARTAVTHLSR